MIYIASPYSHPDPNIRRERYERVLEFTAKCINDGMVVYSPIVHNHNIAVHYGVPCGWDFWHRFDREMIQASEALLVFCDAGWTESIGVQEEIKIAQELGKPVSHFWPSHL